jgi:hypothetical protein
MAKPIPTHEYDAVLNALAPFPQGAGIEHIEASLASPPTRRTLQRWLHELIAQGRVQRCGKGRATRYWRPQPPRPASHATARSPVSSYQADPIPLSEDARRIEAHVRQELQWRTPTGYKQAFLDNYRPNISAYLPEPIRAELHALGQNANTEEPAGTRARQIAHQLLIDLSWNSSRLEGNTYSLLETERLLSDGMAATGKAARDTQMILNHKAAIEFLISAAEEIGFNHYTLLNLHAMLADNLLKPPSACGRLRSIAVGIGQSVFLPLEGPQRIESCFRQVLDTAEAIDDPFEQSFFAMVHLPYLQPFEDVNKRTSRLAANIPLIRRNLCPLSFVGVPRQTYISAMLGVYELNRVELLRDVFIWAYKQSCKFYSAMRQTLGDPDPVRLRYRKLIDETVSEVMRAGMNKTRAIAFVHRLAREQVTGQDRDAFIEATESVLMGLHEGNFARYWVRPSEFKAWQAAWQEKA